MSEGDRELDAWLALKLGWEGYTENKDVMWWKKDDKWLIHNPPHYTGKDWPQLAEALRVKGYAVLPSYFPDDSFTLHGYRYYCQIFRQQPDSEWGQGDAGDQESMGLAIGKAAKQALA